MWITVSLFQCFEDLLIACASEQPPTDLPVFRDDEHNFAHAPLQQSASGRRRSATTTDAAAVSGDAELIEYDGNPTKRRRVSDYVKNFGIRHFHVGNFRNF